MARRSCCICNRPMPAPEERAGWVQLFVHAQPLGPLDPSDPIRMSAPCCGPCYQKLGIIGDAAIERVRSERTRDTIEGSN